jgi:hypothetical protein
MHFSHVPQWADAGASFARSRLTKSSPRKNIEPASRDRSSVCFPRHPSPPMEASETSITGALSVKTR